MYVCTTSLPQTKMTKNQICNGHDRGDNVRFTCMLGSTNIKDTSNLTARVQMLEPYSSNHGLRPYLRTSTGNYFFLCFMMSHSVDL